MRLRREPPTFRRVTVVRTEPLTPHLLRVTLTGPDLATLDPGLPAASVRLLLPSTSGADLVIPAWSGNEFLFEDGVRPTIRTYTPRRFQAMGVPELDLDVVLHSAGAVSAWARAARAGDPAAISGTGRGYAIEPGDRSFLLGGDESAIPAISQLLEVLPAEATVQVVIEVARPDARLELPSHAGAAITWLDRPLGAALGAPLLSAISTAALTPDTRVWVAGEAAAVQRIRKHLFEERGVPRSQCTVRGYWKHGRAGDANED